MVITSIHTPDSLNQESVFKLRECAQSIPRIKLALIGSFLKKFRVKKHEQIAQLLVFYTPCNSSINADEKCDTIQQDCCCINKICIAYPFCKFNWLKINKFENIYAKLYWYWLSLPLSKCNWSSSSRFKWQPFNFPQCK